MFVALNSKPFALIKSVFFSILSQTLNTSMQNIKAIIECHRLVHVLENHYTFFAQSVNPLTSLFQTLMLHACFKLHLHGHALQQMQWNVFIT